MACDAALLLAQASCLPRVMLVAKLAHSLPPAPLLHPLQVTKLCYEVKDADVARARNQLKASLLFMQDSNQRKLKAPIHVFF